MDISKIEKGELIPEFAEVKKLELEILKKFDEFCTVHNLKYCITGGSLLGAVRHKGMIPWDDDIDISMFRPDYDRLIELSDSMPDDCKLFCFEKNNKHSRLYGRICNTDYISVDTYYSSKFAGFFGIDIFPLDAVPSDKKEYDSFAKKIRFLRRLFIFANSALFKGQSFLMAYIIKPIPIIISKIIGRKNIYKMFMKVLGKYNYDTATHIALVTGRYTENEQYSKQKYYQLIRLQFEDLMLPAVSSYDEYLTQIYGDYMQLPPEAEQKPHHSFDLYRVKH